MVCSSTVPEGAYMMLFILRFLVCLIVHMTHCRSGEHKPVVVVSLLCAPDVPVIMLNLGVFNPPRNGFKSSLLSPEKLFKVDIKDGFLQLSIYQKALTVNQNTYE